MEAFASSRVSGLVAAFVFDGQGLEIQAVGPPEQLNGNVADIAAMIASLRRMSLYAKLLGQPLAQDWQAGLTAPFVEESSKAICFLLLLGLAPVVIRTVSDGLIVGAYVGLGFQVLEDLLYGQNAAAAQFGANQGVLGTFVLRALTGISSHALYTALFAAGLIYALGTARAAAAARARDRADAGRGADPRRLGLRGGDRRASCFVVFVLLGTIVFSLVALYVAIRWAGTRERAFMRDILAPEVAAGTITEPELDALTGHRKERRAGAEGRRSRRREKHVLEAARDLAQDLAAGDGEDTPAVMHSRAEIARLRG